MNPHRKEGMVNVLGIFLISVTVTPVSVHRLFPLLMPLLDSSVVAVKGIELCSTAEDDCGHQNAAHKKMCTDGGQVLPMPAFCTTLSCKLYGSRPFRKCLQLKKALHQNFYFFFPFHYLQRPTDSYFHVFSVSSPPFCLMEESCVGISCSGFQ